MLLANQIEPYVISNLFVLTLHENATQWNNHTNNIWWLLYNNMDFEPMRFHCWGFLACYILSTLWELGKHMQYISECYVCKIKAILDMNI